MPFFSEFSYRSSNKQTDIYGRRFDPDGEPKGVVQLAHGVGEHIGRYDDFARFLAENGYVVAGNDHLGHGKSVRDSSELGFFAEQGGWELVVEDMQRLHQRLAEEFPDKPLFLFGHSMGSFLTRTYIIRYRKGLSGVILCGTGQMQSAVVRGGKMLADMEVRRKGASYRSERLNNLAFGSYNDGISPVRTAADWLSRDEEAVDKYNADPLCGFVSSAGLFRDMMGGIAYNGKMRNLVRMKKDLPVFFISGAKDPVGENGRGVIRAYESFIRAGMRDASLKLYPDCRHELLNELNRRQVYQDVLDWINNRAK